MTDDNKLTRQERINLFGKEKVAHKEWWADEMDRVAEVMEELVSNVQERGDTRLARRGKEVGRDGEHTIKLRIKVAGEPWEWDGE